MECPRDGSTLSTQHHPANVTVDRCPTCRGIWLDGGELDTIQRASSRDGGATAGTVGSELDFLQRGVEEYVQLAAGDVSCPRCGQGMSHRRYGLGSQVVIDVCPRDCGVWLDAGEVQQLEALYAHSASETLDVLPVTLWVRERIYRLLGRTPTPRKI